ncbi:MAG: glycosyltransferase family 4 protein [Verrucomicrobiota bacterium]
MRFAFLLNEFRPYGGMQRDCLRLARTGCERGHEVRLLTRKWQGDQPSIPGLNIQLLGSHGRTNRQRDRHFVRACQDTLKAGNGETVLGFLRMPGLDAYFAADPCYQAKIRRLKPLWYRWTPRFRHFARMEETVFQKGASTEILLLHPGERDSYQRIYGTEAARLHVLPPGIAVPRNEIDPKGARAKIQSERKIGPESRLILFVGSGFRTKGLDRLVECFRHLHDEDVHLLVVGQDKADRFLKTLPESGRSRVHILGGREDVADFMRAADLLVHPAYSENTGTVLLEALVRGLPVVTTDTCGFAPHISRSGGGIVLDSPFSQKALNDVVKRLLASPSERLGMSEAGFRYGTTEDLYSCHRTAINLLEAFSDRCS